MNPLEKFTEHKIYNHWEKIIVRVIIFNKDKSNGIWRVEIK